jgi:multidrug resistance protein, MATE family
VKVTSTLDDKSANVVTSGSPYAVVLRLATPTVLAMLTQSIVNEIDIVFFSWLPHPESSNAQAALFPSLILLWMFGGSLSAISVGTQAIAARRFAEGKLADSGAVLVNSWFFSMVAGIVFTLIGYLSLPWVLGVLIKVPEVRASAEAYLQWRLLGIASMAMTFSYKAFFDGIGRTYVHMVSAVVMNVINIVLCLILIFGRWGAPRMGIAGAGVAAFISTWIGLGIMIGWAGLARYRRAHRPFRLALLSRTTTWDILRLSIPSAVATIAVMSGFAMFSLIVSYLDAGGRAPVTAAAGGAVEAVNSAATMVIVGILKLTFTACLAFGTSTATLVSQSLGEGNPDKAARFGWVSVRLGLLIFGVVGFLEGVVFPREILSLVTQSPAVLEAALGPMRIMGICTPLIAVGMILTQALFGAGNTLFVMVVELVLHFLCLVPLAWLLGLKFELGLIGIWSAAVIYVIALTSIMVWKFARGDWKAVRI